MRVLVVSPHPDDETLGTGGTILKLKKNGHQVYWLNLTEMRLEWGWSQSKINRRKDQISAIERFYEFDGTFHLGLPPSGLSQLSENEIITSVKKIYDDVKPEWLILPGNYDAHSDHRVAFDCCMAAAKTFRSPYIRRVTTMEIVSETDFGFHTDKFTPNLFVDITDEIEGKMEALRIYDTEIEDMPFPRSLENVRAHAVMWGGTAYVSMQKPFVSSNK